MAKKPKINYLSRDYTAIKADLIGYIKTMYPDQWQDFNVASPGMAMVELNAYVSDLLSAMIDKKFNENYLDGVTERRAVYRLAKTFGYKAPGVRPGLSVADITIEVPPTADGPDLNYLPIYRAGLNLKGAGQSFETVHDIDFSSDFSEEGIANRTIDPIFNSNQDIIRYKILKREKIKAGNTQIYTLEVGADTSEPFLKVILPENNVLDIVSIIVKPQIGLTETPTFEDFNDDSLRYYEVDYLPQEKIFVEDFGIPATNGIKTGYYKQVDRRFVKEFLHDGRCQVEFGGGTEGFDAYDKYLTSLTSTGSTFSLTDLMDNTALGVKVPANSTIYIKYRVGGGQLSNVGSNTLQQVSDILFSIQGSDNTKIQNVINSTRANNPIPAIGGSGLPSVEEVKYNIAANFASQLRCVTKEDYTARAYQMPGKFGAPFRLHTTVEDNKVKLFVISRDGSGKLISTSTSVIKNNLVEYLSAYRMVNDFVEINDGKVINIQLEIDLFTDKSIGSSNEIKLNVISKVKDFFDVEKWQMNQNIYVSQVVDLIREIPGVINVVDIRFFNMEGGGYSSSIIEQANFNRTQIQGTGGFRTQIEYIDNAIFGTPISMFEIKYPERDVRVRVA